jgi:hypothetical protein
VAKQDKRLNLETVPGAWNKRCGRNADDQL